MDEPVTKRLRLSTEEVLWELDDEDDPMMAGSDDEFDDITCTEKERDEYGAVEQDITEEPNPSLSHSLLSSDTPHSSLSVLAQGAPTLSPTLTPHSSLSVSAQGDPTLSPTLTPHSSLSVSAQGDPTLSPTLTPHSSLSVSAQGNQTHTPPSSLSVLAQRVPTLNPQSPLCLSVPTGSTLSPISVGGGSSQLTINAGEVDPFSLPLSTFFSLPLSSLVTVLHSALTPTNTPRVPPPASVATTIPVRPTPAAVRAPTSQVPRSRRSHPAPTACTSSSGSWSSTLSPVNIAPFTQPVGPTVPISTSELEVFQLFFTDDICSFITEQTNLYAQQILGEKYSEWQHVTVTELRAYFGFMMLMGLYPKPAITDYWRKDPFVNYAPIADRISRDRFLQIHRYLHFVDNSLLPQLGESGYDRLGKVRPIMEQLQKRFLEIYHPHCENAIDEAMIPFQGRSSLKQYMPAKLVKRGIKVWC